MADNKGLQDRRRARLRYQLRRKSGGRPRLSVFRSGKNIYAQVIDDAAGRTLASASTLDKDLKTGLRHGADKDAATAVGKLVAERALAVGVTEVVSVPWPRQGAGRGCPRGRPGLLGKTYGTAFKGWRWSWRPRA